LSDLISDFPLTVAFVFTFVWAKEAVARNNAAEINNVVFMFFLFRLIMITRANLEGEDVEKMKNEKINVFFDYGTMLAA
jgi:hypothetical protein